MYDKTAVIFDSFDELKLLVVEGDHSHLDGTYINSTTADPELEQELTSLVYDSEYNLKNVRNAHGFRNALLDANTCLIIVGDVG